MESTTTTKYRLINSPIDYIRYYINFFYYVGICPFVIKFDNGKKVYWLYTSKFIKIIAFIINVLSLIPELQRLLKFSMLQTKSTAATSYDLSTFFGIVLNVTSLCYRLVILELLWYKSKLLLGLIQLFERPNSVFTKRNIKGEIIAAIQISWMVFFPIAEIISTQEERSRNFYDELDDCAQKQYFLFNRTPTFNIDCNSNSFINSKPVLLGLGVLNDFMDMYTDLAIRFCDGFFLLASTILLSPVEQYCELVRNKESKLEEILEYYESLKDLSRKLNEVFGLLVFAGTVGSLPALVQDLTNVATKFNFFERLIPVVYLLIVTTFFGLSITVEKKGNVLEEYLLRPENYTRFPKEKLTILLYEIQNNKIGLYGAGIFKITAGLFGTVLNMMLSFSIIFMQMQSQPATLQTLPSSNQMLQQRNASNNP